MSGCAKVETRVATQGTAHAHTTRLTATITLQLSTSILVLAEWLTPRYVRKLSYFILMPTKTEMQQN